MEEYLTMGAVGEHKNIVKMEEPKIDVSFRKIGAEEHWQMSYAVMEKCLSDDVQRMVE